MFSVLISIYKKENPLFFQQSLDSIFNQTLLPNEVILVKDGPLTNALDTIINEYTKRYSTLKIINLPINQGLGKALNEGLKHCSYELVARMDTDDIAKPDRFKKQIEVFQKYPNIDVVGAWIEEFENNPSNIISIRKLPETPKEIYDYAKKRCPVNHPVVMFKKSSVLAAGGYQHFPLFEDYYLWVRMLKNGAQFYNVQESLLYFRFSSDMFKRRGGWEYAFNEYKLQKEFRRIDFINTTNLLHNIFIRFTLRILPNNIRSIIYKKLLRKSINQR